MRWLTALVVAVVMWMAPHPSWSQAAEPSREFDGPTQVDGDKLEQVQEDGRPILLVKSVRLRQGTTAVTGKVGRFDRLNQWLTIDGDVRIVEGATTIRGERATYDLRTRQATVTGDVEIEEAGVTVQAPRARYDRDTAITRLGGGVRVEGLEGGRQVDADSLVFESTTGRVEAYGDVVIEDPDEQALVRGQRAVYERGSGDLDVTDRASMQLSQRGQPVLVTADSLCFLRQSDVVEARGGVRVQQGLTEAYAGFARFEERQERAFLTDSPLALSSTGVVRGDTLHLRMRQDAIEQVIAVGDARAIYESAKPAAGDAPPSRDVMRLVGDTLWLRVVDGEADEVRAVGQAETVYEPTGAGGARLNRARGERIRLLLDRGEPYQAIVEGDATGTYYFAAAADTADSLVSGVPGVVDSVTALGSPARLGGTRDQFLGAAAVPDSSVEEVQYSARRMTYLAERGELRLEEEAVVEYQASTLRAGQIRFQAEERLLVATESPELTEGADVIDGDLMTYDLDTRVGQVHTGVTEFERGIYRGAKLERSPDNVFYVEDGAYTTCDLDEPHYHFASRQMKLYLGDKAVAKPLVLHAGRVPILALPFYMFPINKGRQSGLLVPRIEFGVSDRTGRFVRNAGYYWVINDYADLEAFADLNEHSPFFVANSRFRYHVRYMMRGEISASSSFGEANRDWDVEGDWRTLEGLPRFSANIDFLSRRSFRQDAQSLLESNRLDTELRTNLTYEKAFESGTSLTVSSERVQRLQDASGATLAGSGVVTGVAPSVALSFAPRTLGGPPDAKGRGGRWPWLASTSYSFRAAARNTYDSRRPDSRYLRTADGSASLSDARALGYLRLVPSVGASATYVERTESLVDGIQVPGIGHVVTGGVTYGLQLRTEVFGRWRPRLGPYHGFRHVITPSAGFSHTRPFDSRRDLLVEPEPFSSLSLRLGNRLETRLGEPGEFRVHRDFLTFNLTTSYDVDGRSARRFSDINLSGRFVPWTGVPGMNFSLRYDPYERRNEQYSTDLRFEFTRRPKTTDSEAPVLDSEAPVLDSEEPEEEVEPVAQAVFPSRFTLSGSFSFAGGGGSAKHLQTTSTMRFNLTPKWNLYYSVTIDPLERSIVSQRYNIVRDLHCWEARFSRAFSGNRWEYSFRIAARDLPDLFYEKTSGVTRQSSLF